MRSLIWISLIIFSIILISFLFNPDYLPWLIIPLILVFLFITKLDLDSGFIFFIFLFPFLTLVPEQLSGFPVSVAVIIFLLVFFITVIKNKNFYRPHTPLDYPILSLSILVLFSAVATLLSLSYAPVNLVLFKYLTSLHCLFTTYPEDRFTAAIQGARTILFGFVFYYFLIYQLRENNKSRQRILTTFLFTGGVIGVYGLIQYLTKWNLLEYWKTISPNLTRINATFTDPNAYGAYLALVLPIAVAKLLGNKGINFWKYLGLSVLLLLNLLWTASRSAWFGLFISLLFMLIIISFTKTREILPWQFLRRYLKKITTVIFLLVIISSIILILISTHYPSPDFEKHKSYWEVLQFTFNTQAGADTILKNRLPLWQAALNMVAYQPWVGIGIGSYPFWLEYFKGEHITTFMRIAHAHNYFLEIAAELGLLGLGLLLWLLGLIIKSGWETTRRVGLVPLGLLTGLIAFLLAMLTQHALVQPEMQFLFWLPVAMLVSYREIQSPLATGGDHNPIPASNRRGPQFKLGLFILFLFCVYLYNIITPDIMRDRVDYSVGMYKAEANSGYEFRWLNRIGYKQVGIRARTFTLPILVNHPDITQKPVTVQIYLNQYLIDRLTITNPGWTEYQYPVPPKLPTSPDERKTAVLIVKTDRTWNPWQKKGTASFWDYRRLGAGIAWMRWMQPLTPVDHLALDLGTPETRPYLALGWSADELSGDKKTSFTWSQGPVSQIELPLKPGKSYKLRLRVMPFVYANAPKQTMKITLNNQFLQAYTLQNEWAWQEITVQLPSTALNTTENLLKLEYSRVNAPKDVMPDNPDPRLIAVACDSVNVIQK
ncbi:MAG: O-antigen ligase family protein [bacterium]|nr:O-antigen ligase family protein [bacterium]